MLDLNNIAQTAADKYAEGLDKYTENAKTEALNEPTEKDEVNDEVDTVDTSWLDSFSNRDNDRNEFTANDRVDTSIKPETLKEETVFGGGEPSNPEDVYDTSYLDEAFANFNTWQQKAEEDAKKGRQLAYNDEDLKKHIQNIEGIDYKEPNWFERTLGGALPKDTVDATLDMYKQSITNAMNDNKARPMDNDVSETKLPDAIKQARKEYDEAMKKAQDIEANGKTAVPGISAEQERARISNAIEEIKKASERGDAASVRQLLDNLNKIYGSSTASKDLLQSANDSRDNLVDRAEEVRNPKPTATPTATATPTPATPTDSSITNEFDEMFANPNTDSLEEYTGVTKEELPDNVEDAINEAAANPDDAEHWRVLNGLKGKYGDKVDSAINWVQKNLYLHEVPTPEQSDSDKDSETEDTANTGNTEEQTVEPTTTETAGIETIIPQEVVANNPEALEDIQEFITNGDAGGLAQYLINLLGSTALTVIEHAMLSGNKNDPTLQDALKEVWERMPDSEKSGMDKERISAINNAFKAEPSNLKSVGISSEDTSATNESDYNKGMTEQTNEVVSDRTKKYVLSSPWILEAIRKW